MAFRDWIQQVPPHPLSPTDIQKNLKLALTGPGSVRKPACDTKGEAEGQQRRRLGATPLHLVSTLSWKVKMSLC